MTTSSLGWFLAAMLAIATALASLITCVPESESFCNALFETFAGLTVISTGVAIFISRQPPEHWVHSSKPVRVALVVGGTIVTLLVVAVG